MGQPFLARLDVGLPGALLRIMLGAAFAWLLAQSWGSAGWSIVVPLFLLMLFSIKIGGLAARIVLRPSAEVRAIWETRRNLARRYDSYQWRKLLWFGLGILAVAAAGPRADWQIPLGAACVASGAVAQLVWRSVETRLAALAVPAAPK